MADKGKTQISSKKAAKKKTGSSSDEMTASLPSVFGVEADDLTFNPLRREKNDKRQNAGADKSEMKFHTATLSRSGRMGLECVESAFIPETCSSGEGSTHEQGDDADPQSTSSESLDNEVMVPKSFTVFAATKFQYKDTHPHSYSCTPLDQPLLYHKNRAEYLAALASWVAILRIMGDLAEPDTGDVSIVGNVTPLPEFLKHNFRKRYTKKDVEDAQRKFSEMFKDPTADIKDIPFMSDKSETILEKVQFVCGLGMYKSELRDELYCQLCKQLTNNPSQNSSLRGWILLNLMVSSFAPSEKFVPCLLQFLQDSHTDFAQRVGRSLRRTFSVGTRGHPPGWLEFQAAKNGKPILLPITLMNGHKILIQTDSTSTVNEVCNNIADKIGLVDKTGFSLYITLYQRVSLLGDDTFPEHLRETIEVFRQISCLGNGFHRIMDAICECEQCTKQQMLMRESNSSWRLYFRKEYFLPWQDLRQDPMTIELIYHQIMRGVSVGEHKCEKEEDLIHMAAMKYFLEHLENGEEKKLYDVLKLWLPATLREKKEMSEWVRIVKEYIETNLRKQPVNPLKMKLNIVELAKDLWPICFSRFYDAKTIQGSDISWSSVILALKWSGLVVMDDAENQKLFIQFNEIADITKERNNVCITNLQGEMYTVEAIHADDLYYMICSIQDGLKERSKYALAIQDTNELGSVTISLLKGDLVILTKPYFMYEEDDIFEGVCRRTGKQGKFPRDLVYLLFTCKEPQASFLESLATLIKKENSLLTQSNVGVTDVHNLEKFSKISFRNSSESAVTRLLQMASFKKEKPSPLWKFGKEPLKYPLLKRLMAKEDFQRLACNLFSYVLQYMGDMQGKDPMTIDLAHDFIFEPVVQNRYLREELYCQLIRQLTANPEKQSEEKGWKLMWLLTGCIAPVYDMYKELAQFLKTSRHLLAKSCLERLRRVKTEGSRIYPPHFLEYEAISQYPVSGWQNVKISVHYPNSTFQDLEIDSLTKIYDICSKLVKKLKLKKSEGYCLFMGIKDRVFAVQDDEYFYDCVSHLEYFWSQPSSTRNQAGSTLPRLVFMKKLWINAEPGFDKCADVTFHFPQELPNYLRGYHKCSPEEASRLAAFIYLAKYGKKQEHLKNFKEVAPKLIPQNLIPTKSLDHWKKLIKNFLEEYGGFSQDEAKISFLKICCHWPTYGSVFFEVKQLSNISYPADIYIAVNTTAIFLVDQTTKDILTSYSFTKITNWSSEENKFVLLTGDSTVPSKMVFETAMSNLLDDVVMSYAEWSMNYKIVNRRGYRDPKIGESLC